MPAGFSTVMSSQVHGPNTGASSCALFRCHWAGTMSVPETTIETDLP
ncbi:MAG TPA: hypothetical protein VFQ19_09715 [Nocardioidaceae bacterium]|jgi:hypothetical protein|nr:hypothetical protein [Nocardioidaceae bacterium]